MRRVVEHVGPRVIADPIEEHLEGDAVVQVFAGMDFVADVDALLSAKSRIGVQRFASSSKASSTRPAGRCGHG